jgi:hypothetical protein
MEPLTVEQLAAIAELDLATMFPDLPETELPLLGEPGQDCRSLYRACRATADPIIAAIVAPA